MLKRKNIITIVIAAVCGLIGTYLVLSYVNSVKAAYKNENLNEVIVAARSIPENVRITKDMLQVANVEEEYILPETFVKIDEIVGMMTNAGIYKGEQIVKGRISHGDTPSSFSYSIPEGKRAISLGLDTLKSVSGFIQPRDRIDILLTLPKPNGNNTSTQQIAQKLLEGKRVVTFDGSSLTFTLFQNVEIAAIGNVLTRAANGKTSEQATITLCFNPEDVEIMTNADTLGAVKFSLRNPGDGQIVKLKPIVQYKP